MSAKAINSLLRIRRQQELGARHELLAAHSQLNARQTAVQAVAEQLDLLDEQARSALQQAQPCGTTYAGWTQLRRRLTGQRRSLDEAKAHLSDRRQVLAGVLAARKAIQAVQARSATELARALARRQLQTAAQQHAFTAGQESQDER